MPDPNPWLDEEAVRLLESITPDPPVYSTDEIYSSTYRWLLVLLFATLAACLCISAGALDFLFKH